MRPTMPLSLFTGSSNRPLAAAIAAQLGVALGRAEVSRFPDGELRVELHETVRGHDVYLVQPTSPPAEEHLFVLLLLADACKRAGAQSLTAVVPYFGYARQDRRAQGRQPVAARLVADMLATAGFGRVVALDLHNRAMEGIFPVPLEHVSAVPALVAAVRDGIPEEGVVVASDLGATKLAELYARLLGLPTALVHKKRVSGAEVQVRDITGEVAGRSPILVDDMISTGGTLVAAARCLLDAGARPALTVVATHGLLVGDAVERLAQLPLARLVLTDTVAPPPAAAARLPLTTVSVAPILAESIRRLHGGESLSDLLSWG
jgi:ribose-phosphate pyrophosphokinase